MPTLCIAPGMGDPVKLKMVLMFTPVWPAAHISVGRPGIGRTWARPTSRRLWTTFSRAEWAASAERFVFCARASLAGTALQDMIEAQAARLLEEGIVFEGVDGTQLSENLRSHPKIVDDFFGRSWLVAFAGKRRLQRACSDRCRCNAWLRFGSVSREVYNARAQQLDPGLNVDPGRERLGATSASASSSPTSIRPVRSSSRRLSRRTGPPRRPERTTTPWQLEDYGEVAPNPPDSADRRANRPRRLPLHSTTGCCGASARCCSRVSLARARAQFCGALALDLVRAPELFPAVRMTGSVRAYHCLSLLHYGAVSRRRKNAK